MHKIRLNASSAERWLNCHPSAKEEAKYPFQTNKYAQEGTLAHTFAEFYLRAELDEITNSRFLEAVSTLENHDLYSPEMHRHAEAYVELVIEERNRLASENSGIEVEAHIELKLPIVVVPSNGKIDTYLICGKEIVVIDYKYGRGKKVEVEYNPQLMLYALSGLKRDGAEIDTVTLIVHQPRLDHVSRQKLSADYITDWAERIVRPAVKKALAGEGEYIAGNHCVFCAFNAECRALKEYSLAEFDEPAKPPSSLSLEELSTIYAKSKLIKKWIGALEEHVVDLALKKGKSIPGHKIVYQKGSRRWVDVDILQDILISLGLPEEQIFNKKIKGIGDVANMLSKDDFENYVEAFAEQREGYPVLVPNSDKRPSYGLASALDDFS